MTSLRASGELGCGHAGDVMALARGDVTPQHVTRGSGEWQVRGTPLRGRSASGGVGGSGARTAFGALLSDSPELLTGNARLRRPEVLYSLTGSGGTPFSTMHTRGVADVTEAARDEEVSPLYEGRREAYSAAADGGFCAVAVAAFAFPLTLRLRAALPYDVPNSNGAGASRCDGAWKLKRRCAR